MPFVLARTCASARFPARSGRIDENPIAHRGSFVRSLARRNIAARAVAKSTTFPPHAFYDSMFLLTELQNCCGALNYRF